MPKFSSLLVNLNVVHMQAAAAMAVGVGSFSDPDDVPVSYLHYALRFDVTSNEPSSGDAGRAISATVCIDAVMIPPAAMQGMSHYLEHMLFMGSEKFPDENDYDSYLQHNGGAANAYTEMVCLESLFMLRASAEACFDCRAQLEYIIFHAW